MLCCRECWQHFRHLIRALDFEKSFSDNKLRKTLGSTPCKKFRHSMMMGPGLCYRYKIPRRGRLSPASRASSTNRGRTYLSGGRFMTVSGKKRFFQPEGFLSKCPSKRVTFRRGQKIYSQGTPANAIFYIREGRVQLGVLSWREKAEIIGVLSVGDFFGEGCLTGQRQRMESAVADSECIVMRIERLVMLAVLREEPTLSNLFISHLFNRNIPIEQALIDQLFTPAEKRLARLLLLLANFGQEGKQEPVIANVSQKDLAEMVDIMPRWHVRRSLSKFRNLGFIEYNNGLSVHSSLINVILHD